jgi:hypothetical protein
VWASRRRLAFNNIDGFDSGMMVHDGVHPWRERRRLDLHGVGRNLWQWKWAKLRHMLTTVMVPGVCFNG